MGRPLKIESPEELSRLFEEYKTWAHNNPWIKKDFIRSGPDAGQIIDLPTERPLTEVEFAVHCGMSRDGLREYCSRDEFSYIYSRIKDEMSSQRISGGMTGAYNASLVARIDGLVDKQDVKHSGEIDVADALANARKRAHVE
jgi:hypothetical protein